VPFTAMQSPEVGVTAAKCAHACVGKFWSRNEIKVSVGSVDQARGMEHSRQEHQETLSTRKQTRKSNRWRQTDAAFRPPWNVPPLLCRRTNARSPPRTEPSQRGEGDTCRQQLSLCCKL